MDRSQDIFYAEAKSEIIDLIAASPEVAGDWLGANATEANIEDVGADALQAFAAVAKRNEIGLLPKEFRAIWDRAIFKEIDAAADSEGLLRWGRANS